MNEAETHAEHIDPALKAAGWGVVEGSRIHREFPITPGRIEGHGKRGKAEIADYVLVYRNMKLVIVEAKRWDLPHSEGVAQAKSYSGKLAIRFAYSTNGQAIYSIDMQEGTEGDVAQYPTPEELWNRKFAEQNEWRDRFADAKKSDLFDVLAHVAFSLAPISREERAARAKIAFTSNSTANRKSFSTSCWLNTSAWAWMNSTKTS